MITVRLLDPRHLEDYTKTTLFENILKCFANGLIKFTDQLCKHWSVCKKKKLENIWFSKNVSCDWIIFFQVPQIE